MTNISDKQLVQRMVCLMHAMAAEPELSGPAKGNYHYDEARSLAASLPEPVDPDLIEARRIVAGDPSNAFVPVGDAEKIYAGKWDNHYAVQRTLAAIKRGRELERELG